MSRKDPAGPHAILIEKCSFLHLNTRIGVQNPGCSQIYSGKHTTACVCHLYPVFHRQVITLAPAWNTLNSKLGFGRQMRMKKKGIHPFLMECKHLTAGQKFTSNFHICKEMYICYSAGIYILMYKYIYFYY